MAEPVISRPQFPDGYLENPKMLLTWQHVERKLIDAKNYWLCTVRPDRRPHAIPLWGVWMKGIFFFDGSPQTRHSRNISRNPAVALHLESGDEVVILEGACQMLFKPDEEIAETVARAYRDKYSVFGYAPQAEQWDEGGLFEVIPEKVLAWTNFIVDPTRFTFHE
jgi:nitroimidazol reductase NimA-like FMN-containing flavoprotein (pyridoxamine 5'-phosphate oxidase superfamily)